MDVQLKELIEKIKTEGVAKAEKEAADIIAEAKKEAGMLIRNAEEKIEGMRAQAKKEMSQQEQAGKEALIHAGRDLLLSLEKKITAIFDEVVRLETAQALKGSVLEEAVIALVKEWTKQNREEITVLLPKKDLETIESGLRGKLAEAFKKGIDIKPSSAVQAGFHISEKDGAAYYDFSASGIAELLSGFLNPRLAEIMEKAAGRE